MPNTTAQPLKLPLDVLADYPPNTGCIRYRDGSGKLKDWFIAATVSQDTEDTLREHLRKNLPAAEFIGWVIK